MDRTKGVIEPHTWHLKTLIDASAAASPESEEIIIAGAKRITLIFTRTGHSSGNGVLSVDVSLDRITYVDFAKLISNVANTNAQTETRVASVTLNADGSTVVSMDLDKDVYFTMKVAVARTTDGTHTVKALIEY